jgi:2'-5' RNA ligase
VWLPARRPRVLAVRLEDAGGRLTALQGALSERLHAGGWYEPEQRPYLPHVTVARVGGRARVKPAPLPGPPPLSFTPEWVTLFRSHLSPKGARYEALSRAALV